MPSVRTLLALAASAATLALAMPSPASDVAPNNVTGVAPNHVPGVASNVHDAQHGHDAHNARDAYSGRDAHNGHGKDTHKKSENTTDSTGSPAKEDRWKFGHGPVKLPPQQKDHVPVKSDPGPVNPGSGQDQVNDFNAQLFHP